MDQLNFVESDILLLMRNHYKRSEETAKDLDNKAQQNITLSTAIVGFIGVLNLVQGDFSSSRKWILIALFIVYFVSFALSMDTLFPRKWKGEPLEADWDKYKNIVSKPPFDYYDWVIEAYIQAITINANVIDTKRRDVELAMGAIVLEVFIVFAMMVFRP